MKFTRCFKVSSLRFSTTSSLEPKFFGTLPSTPATVMVGMPRRIDTVAAESRQFIFA